MRSGNAGAGTRHYGVVVDTLLGGPVLEWDDDAGRPVLHATKAEAEAARKDFLTDIRTDMGKAAYEEYKSQTSVIEVLVGGTAAKPTYGMEGTTYTLPQLRRAAGR